MSRTSPDLSVKDHPCVSHESRGNFVWARPHFDLIFHDSQRNITLPTPSALARPPLYFWRRTRSRPLSESPKRPHHVTETAPGPSVALSKGWTPSSGVQARGNMGETLKIRNQGIACSTNWGSETHISNIVRHTPSCKSLHVPSDSKRKMQPSKARTPIQVSELGMVTLANKLQPSKA